MSNNISTFYSRWDRQINFLIVFAGIVILYQLRYGLAVLNPTYDAWLMTHDWATHHLGWFFYRNEPWGFPLGEMSRYLYPVGTNVGFTDSIPLAAIFFKIFSPILPDTFQYIGPWMFMCHALTAYFMIRLCEAFSLRGILALAVILIITFNPVLLYRSIHPALCSQWLLIGSFWVYMLDSEKYSSLRLLVYQAIFLIVGCLINPYFSLFEAGFYAALAVRLYAIDKKIKLVPLVGVSAVVFTTLLVLWYAVGFFSFKSQGDLGVGGAYGLYAFNLNSFYNSVGWSAILERLPLVSWHQYESFMYLGVGMMVLILVTIILLALRRFKKTEKLPLFSQKRIFWLPIGIFCVIMTLFAITNVVTFNEHVLFRFELFEKAQKIGDIFRASARYSWVLYYGIVIFTILIFTRLVKNTVVAFASLLLVFSIQVFDYRSLIMAGARPATYNPVYQTPLQEEEWRGMIEKTGSVIFYPPFEATYLTDTDYRYFCYLAADYEKSINLGYAARTDNIAMAQYAGTLKAQLDNGNIDTDALYITTADHVSRFFVPFATKQVYCVKLDGFYAFFPARLKDDPAFASLSLEIPDELLVKKIFESYELKPGDHEEDLPIEIEQIEKARLSIFVKGWTRGDSNSVANLILQSDDGKYFLAPQNEVTATDSVWFRGTVITENLPAGSYKLGAYVHPVKGGPGTLTFFSALTLGASEKFAVMESAEPRFNGWIDLVEESGDEVKIQGWAFLSGQPSMHNRISLVFRSDSKIYVSPTDPLMRPDVSQYFGGSVNISTCGFSAVVSKEKMEKGSYEIGIRISNDKIDVESTEYKGKYISVQ